MMHARFRAHLMLAALSAAMLLAAASAASHGAAGTMTWTELAYPTVEADMHKVLTSSKVTIDSKTDVDVGYIKFYRSGDVIGGVTAGQVVDKDGNDVYEYASDSASKGTTKLVSHNPDFMSILNVGGKIFSVTQFESPRPGVVYLAELEQDEKGQLTTKRIKPVDQSASGGVWIPCAGMVTPWQTHLGSEEYEPNARSYYEDSGVISGYNLHNIHDFMRYFNRYENKTTFTRAVAQAGGFYPYRYGYPWETVVKSDFTETTTKLYVHGRMAYEMSYVMPDEKTVFGTDDGTNVMFHKFVATNAKNLREGKNYCAKYTQTSAAGADAKDWAADVEWIEMPTPTEAEVKAAVESTTWSDLFDTEACNSDGTCPSTGFKSVNTGGFGCECLKVKTGKEKLAAVFEKRRYAGYLGCTTEFRKWEGITYSPSKKKLYTAISAVEYGMEDNKKRGSANTNYDKGTPNHIKSAHNSCGCVMEMDVDDNMSPTKARMLVCGEPDSAADATNACKVTGIANPDNVAVIEDYNQLIIGEDTGSHTNDLIWIWDFNNGTMTRVAATPWGSETTAPYWHTVGNWSYMGFVVQHPYGETDGSCNSACMATKKTHADSTKEHGWVGVVGPFPERRSSPSSNSTGLDSAASCSSMTLTTLFGTVAMAVSLAAAAH